MAVPYLAADRPNARAEFKHPDKSIVVTMLAYYRKGLTLHQAKQMMNALEQLQPSARRNVYRCACQEQCLGELC